MSMMPATWKNGTILLLQFQSDSCLSATALHRTPSTTSLSVMDSLGLTFRVHLVRLAEICDEIL